MRRKNKAKKIKIRRSVRIAYIAILLIIMMLSLFILQGSFNSEKNKAFTKTNIYEYNNKYLYSYDVNMLDNAYIDKESVPDKDVYVTDLMNTVDINMTYVYEANQSSDIEYNYQIIGNLEATYSKEGEEQKVWKKTDVIVPTKDLSVTSDKAEINESFELNMNDKIQMIKDFQQELGIQVQTKYTVLLEITTKTNILGQDVINTYSPDLVFDITSKTTTISTTVENTAKPQIITKMVQAENEFSQVKAILGSIMFVAALVILIVLLVKTKNNNVVRNEYKIELNKILKGCDEKIVEVNSRIDTSGQGLVDVREFDEILKVSEELFKPILYWNNDKEEESWFCVLGNNMVYRYILKR